MSDLISDLCPGGRPSTHPVLPTLGAALLLAASKPELFRRVVVIMPLANGHGSPILCRCTLVRLAWIERRRDV